MKSLYILTEEPSLKIIFETVLPKILPENVYLQILPHQGKQDLENALSKTLPTLSRIPGAKILITRDQDSADCKDVKQKLKELAELNCQCEYSIRIICRELEAWYLGDMNAIEAAFPRFKSASYSTKAEFRNVDKMQSPNRTFLKIVPEYSGKDYLPKLEAAELIAPHLSLDGNKSESFNQTIKSIKKLVSQS